MSFRRAYLSVLCLAPMLQAAAGGTHCTMTGGALEINFGMLDPSQARTVVSNATAVTLNADRAGDCQGVNFIISADDGLNFQGTRRLSNAAGAFIPYTLEGVPTTPLMGPGNGVFIRFSVAARVLAQDYINAPAGSYRDSVLLTISP